MSSEPRQPYDLWSFPMPQAGATPPPPPPPPPLRPPLRPPKDGPSSSPSSRRSAFARWRLALAMVVGLALGAAGMSAVELARGDGSVSLPTTGVTQPVQNPVTQNPVTQSPATTAPAAQSPSGTSGSTATIALNAPERAANQARWSSSVRGTRSNVAVVLRTSWL